jgi:hypothetical protein
VKWGGAGSGGEKMCFGKSKLYAERFPECGKGVKEEGDVGVREGSGSVINDGGSGFGNPRCRL